MWVKLTLTNGPEIALNNILYMQRHEDKGFTMLFTTMPGQHGQPHQVWVNEPINEIIDAITAV